MCSASVFAHSRFYNAILTFRYPAIKCHLWTGDMFNPAGREDLREAESLDSSPVAVG